MSQSRPYLSHPSTKVRFEGKYKGWLGEGFFSPAGRRFFKRLAHKFSRRVGKKEEEEE